MNEGRYNTKFYTIAKIIQYLSYVQIHAIVKGSVSLLAGLFKAIYPKTHHYFNEPHARKINGGKKAINNVGYSLAPCLLENKEGTS